MSFSLWKSPDDNINLGSPFAVFEVFKELAKVIPRREEKRLADLLMIPQWADEDLDKATFDRIGDQAQQVLQEHGQRLSAMATDLLEQLVRETRPRKRRPGRRRRNSATKS